MLIFNHSTCIFFLQLFNQASRQLSRKVWSVTHTVATGSVQNRQLVLAEARGDAGQKCIPNAFLTVNYSKWGNWKLWMHSLEASFPLCIGPCKFNQTQTETFKSTGSICITSVTLLNRTRGVIVTGWKGWFLCWHVESQYNSRGLTL